jgi:hypothetical protein
MYFTSQPHCRGGTIEFPLGRSNAPTPRSESRSHAWGFRDTEFFTLTINAYMKPASSWSEASIEIR